VLGKFDGTSVRLGADGVPLYEQQGYGRPDRGGLRLAPMEALHLLQKERITVEGHDFESLVTIFSQKPGFLRTYLVYRDIRERGYAVQPGPQDLRVFRRGERPGEGRSKYFVRILSERDLVQFDTVTADTTSTGFMRKEHLIAVVDDENELTYYEVREQSLPAHAPQAPAEPAAGMLSGVSVIVRAGPGSWLESGWFGKRLDAQHILLSPVEAFYLLEKKWVGVGEIGATGSGSYLDSAVQEDAEIREKAAVYRDLRDRGLVPRTGYKFGHHFRVYIAGKTHSDLLVHAVPGGVALQMSTISRSVRLATSVKKKMLFGRIQDTTVRYIEFARFKL
jgi:tRNA-intron endonuclease